MHNNKFVVVQIATASFGGIGRLTRDICDILPDNIYEKSIAFGRGKITDSSRDFIFGSKLEIILHGILTRFKDKTGFYSHKGTKELIQFLDKVKPDIIHLHNLHGYYVNIELLFDYLNKSNIPVVWTLHDCWAFTGHCTNFSLIKCDKWKQQCFDCPQSSLYPKSFIDNSRENYLRKKQAFTSVKNLTLITPSKWLCNLVKLSFLKNCGVKVINNGIDLKVFRIKKNPNFIVNATGKKIILGVASSWSKRKGFSDFMRLSKILPKNYIIVMVGLSKKLCKRLPKNIIGIAHTENVDELIDIYNQAYIFLNLTYEDNFPTTNLEAMACGTSVLTYNTGGSVESITSKCGYIVEPHDIETVRDIIMVHKKNIDTQKECRQHSLFYNKYLKFGEYKNLYEDLLRNK